MSPHSIKLIREELERMNCHVERCEHELEECRKDLAEAEDRLKNMLAFQLSLRNDLAELGVSDDA